MTTTIYCETDVINAQEADALFPGVIDWLGHHMEKDVEIQTKGRSALMHWLNCRYGFIVDDKDQLHMVLRSGRLDEFSTALYYANATDYVWKDDEFVGILDGESKKFGINFLP